MFGNKRIIALIGARGGSKRLPRKNLRSVGGRPMIAWTIEAAKASHHLDRTILSSDDIEIIETARSLGCEVPFVRPAELAEDDTLPVDVALHALEQVGGEFDYLILLQPTSPLRRAADIDRCIEICVEAGAPSCAAVSALEVPIEITYLFEGNGRPLRYLTELGHLDDSLKIRHPYRTNGAAFMARTDWLRDNGRFISAETVAYEMPRERSVDVDTESDLIAADALLRDTTISATTRT